MTHQRFQFERLGSEHSAARSSFSCGVPELDTYLREQAGQDMRRGIAVIYVLWDGDREALAGFYSLSATSVEPTDLPDDVARRLPRYAAIPAILLGRLALAAGDEYRGHGLGRALLIDALLRARQLSREVGAVGVVVDAKDENVRSFYERYGFVRFADQPIRLMIPMRTIDKL